MQEVIVAAATTAERLAILKRVRPIMEYAIASFPADVGADLALLGARINNAIGNIKGD